MVSNLNKILTLKFLVIFFENYVLILTINKWVIIFKKIYDMHNMSYRMIVLNVCKYIISISKLLLLNYAFIR